MVQTANYQHNEVITSNRVRLIVMLYEGAINFLEIAKGKMDLNDIPGKALYLDKASAVISELLCSLDTKSGGEIARNLQRLYDFMLRQISEANVKDDVKPLETVSSLLRELKAGWNEIARQSPANLNQHLSMMKKTESSSLRI